MTMQYVYSSLAEDPDLGELVDIFVQEMPARVDALETQARCCDWQQLKRAAHQIKGAAGSYGFAALTPPAARLELALAEGCPEEEVLSVLAELLVLCRGVRCGRPQPEDDGASRMGSDFQ
jgi:histidine phosphotransfer protein HptB